MQRFYNCI